MLSHGHSPPYSIVQAGEDQSSPLFICVIKESSKTWVSSPHITDFPAPLPWVEPCVLFTDPKRKSSRDFSSFLEGSFFWQLHFFKNACNSYFVLQKRHWGVGGKSGWIPRSLDHTILLKLSLFAPQQGHVDMAKQLWALKENTEVSHSVAKQTLNTGLTPSLLYECSPIRLMMIICHMF